MTSSGVSAASGASSSGDASAVAAAMAKVQSLSDRMFSSAQPLNGGGGGGGGHVVPLGTSATGLTTELSASASSSSPLTTTRPRSQQPPLSSHYQRAGGLIEARAPIVVYRVSSSRPIALGAEAEGAAMAGVGGKGANGPLFFSGASGRARKAARALMPPPEEGEDGEAWAGGEGLGTSSSPSSSPAEALGLPPLGSNGDGSVDPPTVLEATRAYATMRAAWRSVHAQLLAVTERLAEAERRLGAERRTAAPWRPDGGEGSVYSADSPTTAGLAGVSF